MTLRDRLHYLKERTLVLFITKPKQVNIWEKVFVIFPRYIILHDIRTNSVSYAWCCCTFVQRKFTVTQGMYRGIEYQTLHGIDPRSASIEYVDSE